jgi:hypothetical protein
MHMKHFHYIVIWVFSLIKLRKNAYCIHVFQSLLKSEFFFLITTCRITHGRHLYGYFSLLLLGLTLLCESLKSLFPVLLTDQVSVRPIKDSKLKPSPKIPPWSLWLVCVIKISLWKFWRGGWGNNTAHGRNLVFWWSCSLFRLSLWSSQNRMSLKYTLLLFVQQ